MLKIDYIGGNCPIQAEGTILGQPFYFRARHEHWSMNIGDDYNRNLFLDPRWQYEEWHPNAGWMDEDEALACLYKAIQIYRLEVKRGRKFHRY